VDVTLLLIGLAKLTFGPVVGISVPVDRDGLEEHGREYARAETTADLPLGHLHPSPRTPFDCKIVSSR